MANSRRATFYLAVFLLFLNQVSVQGAEPASRTFIVHTLDGPLAPAPLESLAEDWSIRLGGQSPRTLAGTDWLSLRRDGPSLPPYPDKNVALLTSGDRILLEPGAPFRFEEERVVLRLERGAEISVPVAFLAYLCVRVPEDVDDPALFLARLDKIKRPHDVIQLKSGDRIEGALESPAPGPVYTINLGKRSVATPLEQIAILAVNTELQSRPKLKKPYVHVVTAGGARLHFGRLRLDAQRGVLVGRTLFGADLDVPLAQVACLSVRQGPAVYLSDLTPKVYECTPFLGVGWPLVTDAAVTGRQLFLVGNYYDKGLGMHTQSRVAYSLGGDYRWFEAWGGLDVRAGTRGQARVSVALDGMTVISRKVLTERNPLLPIRIDVRQARELTLLIEFGDFGDVQGQVNFADARLIR